MSTPNRHPQPADAHDHGLQADLDTLRTQIDRRQALRWLGMGSVAATPLLVPGSAAAATSTWWTNFLATLKKKSSTTTGSTGSTGSTGTTSGACSVVPEETQGPYPGDGSNTANGSVANALALSGIVRSDIRSSIAGATGVAAGVPLKLIIKLVNVNSSCAALDGYAIYLWHCDAVGRYSMYSAGATAENYLRGVQPTDSSGQATFQTIFPGCYSGRMPHMHFEVYRSSTTATSFSNKLKTSQLAFPNEVSTAVYADSRYTGSAANFAKVSFATDGIFSDGYSLEMTSLTGDATNGYSATITVGISV